MKLFFFSFFYHGEYDSQKANSWILTKSSTEWAGYWAMCQSGRFIKIIAHMTRPRVRSIIGEEAGIGNNQIKRRGSARYIIKDRRPPDTSGIVGGQEITAAWTRSMGCGHGKRGPKEGLHDLSTTTKRTIQRHQWRDAIPERRKSGDIFVCELRGWRRGKPYPTRRLSGYYTRHVGPRQPTVLGKLNNGIELR